MTDRRLASTIERVTVYREGAVVLRRAPLTGPEARRPGAALVLGPLPLTLDEAGVRARVDGGHTCAVADVRVVLALPPAGEALVSEDTRLVREAERELERLESEEALARDELERLGALSLELAPTHPKRAPKPLPLGAWRELEAWRRAERRRLTARRGELAKARREANEALAALRQRLAKARAAQSEADATVCYEVHLTLRGRAALPEGASLVLEYPVRGARWVPSYVLRVARDGRSAELALRAQVAQASGEAWTRAQLSLSTASLVRELDLPELASLRLGRREEVPARTGWRPPPEGLGGLFAGVDATARPKTGLGPGLGEALDEAARALERLVPPRPSVQPPPPPAPPRPPMPQAAAELELPTSGAMAPPMMASAPAPAPMQAPAPKRGGVSRARVTTDVSRAALDDAFAEAEEAAPPEPPPVRTGRAWLRYGALAMRGPGEAERGTVQPVRPSHVALSRALSRAAALASAPVPAGTWAVAHDNGHFDCAYTTEAPVEVPDDGAFHGVPVLTRAAPIATTLVVVPREGPDAVRVATLRNPLPVPLLPGPADVYLGEELLVTAPVYTTVAGGELRVGLGVEERLKVARNVSFDEEQKGLLGGSTHLRHEVTIELGSRLPTPVEVEVREVLPIRDEAEKEDLEVAVLRVEPPWEDYDQRELGPPVRGGRRWRFTLAPGEDRRVVYGYAVKIGAKYELVGGARRGG